MSTEEATVIIAASFVISILVARAAVKLVWGIGIDPLKNRRIAGLPVHHFSYGLMLLTITGYVAIATSINHWLVPCLFGAGLGLIVDELYVVNVVLGKFWMKADTTGKIYWGKASYFVATTVGALLIILTLIAQIDN